MEVSAQQKRQRHSAFTLIELLVVITIIVILMALLFPAFRSVQDQAKKTQAKNDLTQIVTAVNAFYTEYGKYPTTSNTSDVIFGPNNTANHTLFDELRGVSNSLNTRQIVFISPPDVKDAKNPRSGIATQAATLNGISISVGDFVDPWETPYNIEIDADYDNQITTNPYGDNAGAGSSPLHQGVIAWSLGKDATLGTKNGSSAFTNSDDVISWQ